ncbi:hypothetical protein [uncultured Alsobacter sp.]|uniref:hypothetical protein n=1 Tax=uncultured Alsobacter sp. TaxID=1748258 RepID=UPI0025F8F028|nr:hypothetical protein [uncultured Alsobacter sp.]
MWEAVREFFKDPIAQMVGGAVLSFAAERIVRYWPQISGPYRKTIAKFRIKEFNEDVRSLVSGTLIYRYLDVAILILIWGITLLIIVGSIGYYENAPIREYVLPFEYAKLVRTVALFVTVPAGFMVMAAGRWAVRRWHRLQRFSSSPSEHRAAELLILRKLQPDVRDSALLQIPEDVRERYKRAANLS